ncbi:MULTISPECIES: IS110 family transposase [Rhodococcus erythropolis group]|uniref:IS110 family transposase n=1 Tax=Rhodococcus erythropolis TaxID=1833 RepID=A0A8I0ZVR2_RHOER|nr:MULTISPECIES: IS110 family transposase [Rhodococcus erythropolis group]MBH5144128.1 IS110 family transposase [Rhodococcus erythropolis]MBH5144191.1 IS110 family transposase [Rhodococcus erythropolis]MBH5144305.1 IS110 family transposase [Rhodococcus erythropolis]MBH5146640.1 IS110 family transposase [Rhodococcus erythropolis]MDJ0435229.1 IS110 family transposase [Rhodococcus qingshengii]
MRQLWAGIDAGKAHHHCVVIDSDGTRLLSQRVANDETELSDLIDDALGLSDGGALTWAVDLNNGAAALLIALMTERGQRLLYIPGRVIHHAAGSYRGDSKTDAKDAAIIADQARMRRDLHPMRAGDEISVELGILTSRRTDLMRDRTRTINRLRALLGTYFPALERALDISNVKATLILLSGYQTPDGIRRLGQTRLEAWLRKRKAYNATGIAAKAIDAAHSQHTRVAGQDVAAWTVAKFAVQVMNLDTEMAELDRDIEERFRRHHHAAVIESMPGFGPLLGAELIAATGGDFTAFGTADRLAGISGLAPVPRDSGRVSGNLHRPRRYDRRLLRAFYLSAQLSLRSCVPSQTYYARKREEGKRHTQAVLALARRRLNVLWAMLRDDAVYRQGPSIASAG